MKKKELRKLQTLKCGTQENFVAVQPASGSGSSIVGKLQHGQPGSGLYLSFPQGTLLSLKEETNCSLPIWAILQSATLTCLLMKHVLKVIDQTVRKISLHKHYFDLKGRVGKDFHWFYLKVLRNIFIFLEAIHVFNIYNS